MVSTAETVTAIGAASQAIIAAQNANASAIVLHLGNLDDQFELLFEQLKNQGVPQEVLDAITKMKDDNIAVSNTLKETIVAAADKTIEDDAAKP